jgi:raffinose/stachyose/melibiose transport system substrate-binding protein
MPAYKNYDAAKIADPLSQEIYEYAAEGKTIGWVFRGGPVGWHEGLLGPTMQKYLSGKMTWEELETETRKEWEKARQ